MPDNETQEAPAAPAERASEGQGWWGSLKDSFYSATLWAGDAIGIDSATEAKAQNDIRMSDTPGTDMLAAMAGQEGFKPGQPGNAQLAAIQNDPAFMASLNSALVSDRSIMARLAAAGEEGGQGMGPAQLVEQLADPTKRGVMTQVLTKIGEDANDGFGANYLNEVMSAAQTEDYAALDGVLQQGGISNSSVRMGAMLGPLAKVGNFLRDPDGATRDWINDPNGPMSSLSEDNKNMVAGLVQALSKFFGMYTGPGGFAAPYLELGQRIGGELAANGADVRGVPNLPSPPTPDGGSNTVGASGNPSSAVSARTAFNPLGMNRPPAEEPDANTPNPQVARVEHTVTGRTASGQVMAL